jgi:glucose-6-phosphate isomerase
MLRYDYSNMLSPQIKNNIFKKEDLFKLKIQNFNKDDLTFRNLIYSDVTWIKNLGKEIREKYENYVVVGIGGSDLGSRTIVNALKSNNKGINVLFIGANTDPDELKDFFENLSLE